MTFKSLNNLTPVYLKQYFQYSNDVHAYNTRSADYSSGGGGGGGLFQSLVFSSKIDIKTTLSENETPRSDK